MSGGGRTQLATSRQTVMLAALCLLHAQRGRRSTRLAGKPSERKR